MSTPLFIAVDGVYVNLDHVIAWEYTPAHPGGEIDAENGETTMPRRSKIKITTTATVSSPETDYGGNKYLGVGQNNVTHKAFGPEADVLRDRLNAMVMS